MANLFGSQPKVIPEFTGLQVNTAVQVLPIPIIYGAPRININLIYYNGFSAKKVKTGGKGVLSGGKGSQQIEYFATIILALGEGVIGSTYIIYQDSNVYVPSNYPTNGTAFFNGAPGQLPWSVIQTNWPADARPYANTAYYGFYNAQLDSSATVPQIDLVVAGHLAQTSPLNNDTITITTGQYDSSGNPLSFIGTINLPCLDADPAQVILDFLTNPTYGAGFPYDFIDSSTLISSLNSLSPGVGDSAVSSFCQAVGIAWSVVLNNVESAASILERWCKNINTAIVWDGSLLKFIPYWNSYAAGNPGWSAINGIPKKYYNPLMPTPILTITMDDILQSSSKEEDPITFAVKDPLEVYNTVRVDFKDRFNYYNDVPAEAKDEAHIELYGPRTDNIGLANEFSRSDYANVSALMQLRRNVGIVNTYTWKMSPLWAWLAPMYVISIPDPSNYGQTIAVRIISVEDDADENVTFVAEEFAGATQSPTAIPVSQTTPPNQGATNIPPSPVFTPIIVEPTTAMLTAMGFATPQIVIAMSGGTSSTLDPNWGGANVWLSLDGVNYEEVGTQNGPSTIGIANSPLPAYTGTNPDLVDTLTVYLGESGGSLNSVDPVAAAAGNTFCVIQDINGYEVFSYTTATLIAPFTYSLTGLYRGFYSTTPRAFAAGSQFVFLGTSPNIFSVNLPSAYIGQNFFVKLQSFNTFNLETQDLTSVVAYEYFVNASAGSIIMVDTVATTDGFLLSGQYSATLFDSVASSDSFGATAGISGSLSDTIASSETWTPPVL